MEQQSIVGIGPLSPPITGPGIKNKHLKRGLEEKGLHVSWVNTLERRPGTLLKLGKEVWQNNRFLVSASTKVRFGTAFLLSRRLQSPEVGGVLLPAGGRMATELRNLPVGLQGQYLHWFSQFDCILPESDALTADLRELFDEVVTISTLPNLRQVPDDPPDFDKFTDSNRLLRLVYVGRIKETKGLDQVLDAIDLVNEMKDRVTLDIFGHFLESDDYRRHFLRKCDDTQNAQFLGKIKDGGVIPKLRKYDVFVFPTYYPGEGFPGVFIEAFAGGCLVIASDWNYNSELIDTGVNGLLFDPKNRVDLQDKIQFLLDNPENVDTFKMNAWQSAKRYSVETVTSDLIQHLEQSGW